MTVASLCIALFALVVSLWNAWYRVRDDSRGRWWSRLTWALDRDSDDTGVDADRRLAWDMLTYHLTTAPARRNKDDQALLDAVRRWLQSIAVGDAAAYDRGPDDKEQQHE